MPLGIGLIFLVAACAKIMRPAATIHVTSMELVTANLPIVNSSVGFQRESFVFRFRRFGCSCRQWRKSDRRRERGDQR